MTRAYRLDNHALIWRAVLGQSIRDLSSPEKKTRTAVVLWLNTQDFHTVCDFAYVEPDQMISQMAALATMPLALARKYGDLLRAEVMKGVHYG